MLALWERKVNDNGMQFTSARAIEQCVWQMRLSDYPRGLNRARINSLANGAPPYSEEEEATNNIEVNVNDLTLTRLSHDARQQLYQAFNKPGNFFTASTDGGAADRRSERGQIVTSGINRIMKRSDLYFECTRSKLALTVLHGIGPSNWESECRWCPIPLGVEEVLVPSNTLLTFRNLPFFAVFRSYTGAELRRLTRNREAAAQAGWNLDAVDRSVEWADEQTSKLFGGSTWAEFWSPEKAQERFKQDSGIFASDLVQTIDCWDFYFWDDAGKHEGWRRRIIFDAWGGYSAWNGGSGYGARAWDARNRKMDFRATPSKNLIGDEKGMFLFSSGNRVVGDALTNLIHFQFADLSAVAPFRYHSVRSLGFLLYAVCHLQNRLRCSFSESVFEALLNYMRVRTLDEAERALKVQLANRGIIDDTVQFLPPSERWQPNAQLIELGLNEFKQTVNDNSSSYVQNQNFSRDRVEKTKFQVMAEVNAMQTLVSAALQQAYRHQTTEYREIFRRFLLKDSRDPDVNEFRARCLARGVPERLLVPEAWDIEPERILGGGNKTLEMAISQQLMEWRPAYGPQAQQQILRDATLAITDDASRAETLVPRGTGVSDSAHDAMVAFGSLMVGAAVALTEDQNRLEVVQVWLGELGMAVQRAEQMGNMVSPDRLVGMQNALQHVSQLIGEIGKDEKQKETAKQLAAQSGQLANKIKGFAQRLQQQMKAQAAQGGEGSEMMKAQAKIAADAAQAQVKMANARESHAQKTAQKQVSFEAAERRAEEQHQLELRRELESQQVEDANRGMETAANIRINAVTAAADAANKANAPKEE